MEKIEIDEKIKMLQKQRAEIVEKEKIMMFEKIKKDNISKESMTRLYGYSKEKAVEKVKEVIKTISDNDGGINEAFGYLNDFYISTSATIDDIKKDNFFIDLLIAKVGMKAFKDFEKSSGQKTRRAANIGKNFYTKIGKKDIVSYLKEKYPIKEEKINWIVSNKIGKKDILYKAKTGNIQKSGRIGIYFDLQSLADNNLYKGDRIAVAVMNNKILVKKDDKGLKLTRSGTDKKLSISMPLKDINIEENKLFYNMKIQDNIITYTK